MRQVTLEPKKGGAGHDDGVVLDLVMTQLAEAELLGRVVVMASQPRVPACSAAPGAEPGTAS